MEAFLLSLVVWWALNGLYEMYAAGTKRKSVRTPSVWVALIYIVAAGLAAKAFTWI